MEELSSPSMYQRPTSRVSAEDKSALDKMCKKSSSDHIRHLGNHLHNLADKLEEHAKQNVTMDDYNKAKIKKDTDNDGD